MGKIRLHSHIVATFLPWVVMRNAWERDPGGWAVSDPTTTVVARAATLHFRSYWARQAVGDILVIYEDIVSEQYVVEFPGLPYFWGYFIKHRCFSIFIFS